MSKNSSDSVWESILIFVVVGALAVVGYRKAKPHVESWLADHGVNVGDLANGTSLSPTELFIDAAAVLLGLALLVALIRTWRQIRNRNKDDKKKAKVWR